MEIKKYEPKEYLPSAQVTQAQTALDANLAQKPADYQSQWQPQLDSLYDQITARKPFQYNINEDALYNQYKDQYIRGGQLAMMDTMGKAASLTGGFGSSYAQQVGQQAFQGYLQGLNDRVPQLAQLAYDRYNQQGSDLYKQYSLLAGREQQDYGRYQDAYNLWLNDRNYLTQVLGDTRNFDYGQYQADRNFGYQDYRNQVADQQWQTQFDEQVRQWNQLHPAAPAFLYHSGGSTNPVKPDDKPESLQQIAAKAADMKKDGRSAWKINEYLNDSVANAIPGGTATAVGQRILAEMKKAQGLKP